MTEIIEKKPKISVIVPVYKVENYLNECVDSILNQTYVDFEVVLVDDGSPDKCPQICDEYAKKDARVNVVHKKNGGLSSARNAGIEAANGEYLLFLDSDDYYGEIDFLYNLSETIKEYNPDAVFFSMRPFDFESRKYYYENPDLENFAYLNCISKHEALKNLLKQNKMQISACMYAVRKDFLIRNDLFFTEGLVCEDIDWSLRMFSLDLNVKFLNQFGSYSRRGREGSITSTIGTKNINDLFSIVKTYADRFRHSVNEDEQLLLNYVAYQYSILCGLLARIDDKAFVKQRMRELKEYKWLLTFDFSPKVKKVARIAKIIGITNTMKLLQFYIKHRGK